MSVYQLQTKIFNQSIKDDWISNYTSSYDLLNIDIINNCLKNWYITINKWTNDPSWQWKKQIELFKSIEEWDSIYVHYWNHLIWVAECISNDLISKESFLDNLKLIANQDLEKHKDSSIHNKLSKIVSEWIDMVEKYDFMCYYVKKVKFFYADMQYINKVIDNTNSIETVLNDTLKALPRFVWFKELKMWWFYRTIVQLDDKEYKSIKIEE